MVSNVLEISLTVDRSLTRKLFQHLGGTSESVTRFTNANVQNELLNLQLLHGVGSLLGSHFCGFWSSTLGVVVELSLGDG